MTTITLAKDLPGCHAGTVFTLDKKGNYRDPSGKYWLAPRAVEESPDLVAPPPVATGTPYAYVDDAGAVIATTWQGSKRDDARKAIGNTFATEEEAKRAASARVAVKG